MSVTAPTYSVPTVAKELASKSMAQVRFNTSRDLGRLFVRAPTPISRQAVQATCMKLGEGYALSEVDQEVLALALELKLEGNSPVVVSDDYSIQNVANHIGVKYASLATFGITYGFGWILYCPACFKEFEKTDLRVCPVCGTGLKRRVSKKMPAKKRA